MIKLSNSKLGWNWLVVVLSMMLASPRSPLGVAQVSQEGHHQDPKDRRERIVRHAIHSFGNPAALIRAANVLRREEMEDAVLLACIAEASRKRSLQSDWWTAEKQSQISDVLPEPLRQFIADEDTHWQGDKVQLLLLATFAPKGIMPPSGFLDHEHPCSLMGPVSMSWPVMIMANIPFDLSGVEAHAVPQPERGQFYSHDQAPRNILEFVRWARANAVKSENRLVPPDDVVAAIDKELVALTTAGKAEGILGEEGMRELAHQVRGETLRLLEGAFDKILPDVLARDPNVYDLRRDLKPLWTAVTEVTRTRQLRWNDSSERYEVKDR